MSILCITLQTSFLNQLFRHKYYICAVIATGKTIGRAPIADFFHPDLFFSPSGCLGLILKNPIKSVFFLDKIWQRAIVNTGPSPGFSSRGAKNQKEGPKTRRGATFLKYNIGCMQQPGGQTWNGGAPISNRGAGHHWPPRYNSEINMSSGHYSVNVHMRSSREKST